MSNFLPADFSVPNGYQTDDFIVRPLKITDVVKDYDAVMTNVDHLQHVFGPSSTWPRCDLSFEQDMIDLGWHTKSFSYANHLLIRL